MNAKNFLEKRYNEEMELDDAVHTALLTLREGFEGSVPSPSLSLSPPSPKPRHALPPSLPPSIPRQHLCPGP